MGLKTSYNYYENATWCSEQGGEEGSEYTGDKGPGGEPRCPGGLSGRIPTCNTPLERCAQQLLNEILRAAIRAVSEAQSSSEFCGYTWAETAALRGFLRVRYNASDTPVLGM